MESEQAFNRDSSSKLLIEGSIRQRSSWRFCLLLRRNWQRKKKVLNCFDFSTTVTHGAYTIFELMIEFMLKWLNFSCSLPSNFKPIWSCTENSNLCFDLKHWFELLERFSFAHGVSKAVRFPNTNRKERILEVFCSLKKFL